MALKLMYITNRIDIADIVISAGVDRVFVDLEVVGKSLRQGGMNTVQSHHTVEDIVKLRENLPEAELMVRCNPIHDADGEYNSTEQEIDAIIQAGADIIMLPFFKTVEEVQRFIRAVNSRARTLLLFETPESVDLVHDIIELPGVDEVFIGLNDLSLGYGMKFMFQLLADGTVERLCNIFSHVNIPYGFGGIAALGNGILPAERVISEHYRLGSTCAILSRSFCNTDNITDISEIKKIFDGGVQAIRDFEQECAVASVGRLEQNRIATVAAVEKIVKTLERKS